MYSYGWYFRVDGFFWGVLISLFAHEFSKQYLRLRPTLFDKSLIRLPCSVFFVGLLALAPKIPFLSSVAAIAAIAAILVFLASYDKGYTFGNSPFSNAMVAIGARSYTLYVIHIPLFFFTSSTIDKLVGSTFDIALVNTFSFLVSFALLASLTEINYRYVEIPLRDKGRKIAQSMSNAE